MKILKTFLSDVLVIEPTVFRDDRGYFCETFREDILSQQLNHRTRFIQENESKSSYGVLRGLHFQVPPFAQTKLVRVVEGQVLDVVVDLRAGSKTFGKYYSTILSGENKRQLYVPRGFGHGFVVLSNVATFVYKVDNFYSKESERGLAFDDVKLGIDWRLSLNDLVLSDKDRKQPLLKDISHECDLFNIKKNLYD